MQINRRIEVYWLSQFNRFYWFGWSFIVNGNHFFHVWINWSGQCFIREARDVRKIVPFRGGKFSFFVRGGSCQLHIVSSCIHQILNTI